MSLLIKLVIAIIIIWYVVAFSRAYYPYFKLENDIEKKGIVPKEIEDFPVHGWSLSRFQKLKPYIEKFLESLRNNKPALIVLNSNDLNTLNDKGEVSDKRKSGTFVYYEIDENKIVERKLDWPTAGGRKGFIITVFHITFEKQGGKLYEVRKVVEDNSVNASFEIGTVKKYELVRSNLLFRTMILVKPQNLSGESFFTMRDEIMLLLADKVKNIDIRDNKLYIES